MRAPDRYHALLTTGLLSALLRIFTLAVLAAAPSAEQVLSGARSKAASEDKAIFVHFSASWCPWCQRLEAWLEQPDIKPVFEKHFVRAKLVIRERGEADLKRIGSKGRTLSYRRAILVVAHRCKSVRLVKRLYTCNPQ